MPSCAVVGHARAIRLSAYLATFIPPLKASLTTYFYYWLSMI